MTSLLGKIVIFIKLQIVSFYFSEGWDKLAHGKPEEAEKLFNKGEDLCGKLPIQYKVMRGKVKFNLRKNKECFSIFIDAWKDIDADNKLSSADKAYLKGYMYGALEIFKEFLSMEPGVPAVFPEDIPLSDVSKALKRRFPFRDHPDWEEYGV